MNYGKEKGCGKGAKKNWCKRILDKNFGLPSLNTKKFCPPPFWRTEKKTPPPPPLTTPKISSPFPFQVSNTINPTSALYEEEQVRIATAIYPTTSLLNHSCDPTIINRYGDR